MFVRNVQNVYRKTPVITKRTMSLSQNNLEINEELCHALHRKQAVIALESTIITHGMPYPQNVTCALEVENIVREQGAIPATIAIKNGKIKVGLTESEINELGDTNFSKPIKTSRRDLAYVVSNKKNGGTTVSGTLIVAKAAKIPIFATGGIGGVHRASETTFDISADLIELGKSDVAVVSSGIKSILDIPKTLEFLETQGVFVATFGLTNDFPAFYSTKSGVTVPYNLKTPAEVAELIKSNRDLNMDSGILLGVPIPEEYALNSKVIEQVIEMALRETAEKNIVGKYITPFLLSKIASITEGKSLTSNIALIKNNAKVAAQISVVLQSIEQSALVTDDGPFETKEDIERRPIIIGGSNIDCSAVLDTEEIKLDGRIYKTRFSFSPGGVGRNMCEAMYKLDCPPNFLTVVGDDLYGVTVQSSIPKKCTNLLKISKNNGTAQCTIVFDRKGNCKMLMGDMELHKQITPEIILDHEEFIKKSPLVIIDANLTIKAIDTILAITNKHNIPVLYEPTDPAVATKLFKLQHRSSIKVITPNLNELKEIATFLNIQHKNSSRLEDVAEISKEMVKYVENVIITLGSKGILIARKGLASDTFLDKNNSQVIQVRHYPTSEISKLVNVSGAGDCFASGFIAALIANKSEEICVSVGFAAAKLALQTKNAVPKYIFDKSHESWNSPAGYKSIFE